MEQGICVPGTQYLLASLWLLEGTNLSPVHPQVGYVRVRLFNRLLTLRVCLLGVVPVIRTENAVVYLNR